MRERGNCFALRRLALLALLALLFSSSGAKANTIKPTDTDRLQDIQQKLMTIERDLLDSTDVLRKMTPTDEGDMVKHMEAMDCMQRLIDSASLAGTAISALQGFATIGVAVRNKRDEAIVNEVTESWMKVTLGILKQLRNSANFTSGFCSDSAIVNTKANVILDFVDRAARAVRPIGERLGLRE